MWDQPNLYLQEGYTPLGIVSQTVKKITIVAKASALRREVNYLNVRLSTIRAQLQVEWNDLHNV